MVPAHSIKVSRVSMYSGYRHVMSNFAYGTVTLFGWISQNHSAVFHESIPRSKPRIARDSVWPLPVSLAATPRIDVSFSSSGYLDVSVHRVPFHTLCIGVWMTGLTSRVSPFRYPWITGYLHLPAAFRSLSRLSSALSAKASTLRSLLLDLARVFTRLVLVYSVTLTFNSLMNSFSKNFLGFFSDVLIFESISSYLCMKFSRYVQKLYI